MSTEMIDYKEMTREMRCALDEEQERLTDKIDRLNGQPTHDIAGDCRNNWQASQ